MRFGLFGTGPWATTVHGPALVAHPGAELVGVWGRDPAKTDTLAQVLQVRAYADVDALVAEVDAIAVALPPDIQAPIAHRAAQAGKHLLLDKPVALTTADADAVLAEVSSRGLASAVFFTSRFQPEVGAFLREAAGTEWFGGWSAFHASLFPPGQPVASPWRKERGGLWDVGPHALSLLLPTLGPVERVSAMTGRHDTATVLLGHRGGAVSTMSLTVDGPPGAAGFETVLYGPKGAVPVPAGGWSPREAFGAAIDALLEQAAGGTTGHPCDVRLGRDVVAILAAADAARGSGAVVAVAAAPGPEPVPLDSSR